MVIRVLDIVEKCQSDADGIEVYNVLKPLLKKNTAIQISFEGVNAVPSSFVNAALIELLDDFNFVFIKSHISFVNTNKQINEMIKKRFEFEVFDRKKP